MIPSATLPHEGEAGGGSLGVPHLTPDLPGTGMMAENAERRASSAPVD